MNNNGVSRRHFFFGSLLAGAAADAEGRGRDVHFAPRAARLNDD